MKFRSFNRENACRKVKHRDTITPFSPNVLTAIRQGMPISSMDANKDSNECVKGTAGKDIIQKIYMYNTYTLTSCYDTWNGIHVHTNNLKCLDIWCWYNTFFVIVGVAYVRGACLSAPLLRGSAFNFGIGEASTSFNGVIIAAHEVGHL